MTIYAQKFKFIFLGVLCGRLRTIDGHSHHLPSSFQFWVDLLSQDPSQRIRSLGVFRTTPPSAPPTRPLPVAGSDVTAQQNNFASPAMSLN